MSRNTSLAIYTREPVGTTEKEVAEFPLGGSSFSDSVMEELGITPAQFHDANYWIDRVMSPSDVFALIDGHPRWFGMDEVLKNKHNLESKYDKPEYVWVIEIDG